MVARALVALAEGDEIATDGLTDDERRVLCEGLPSVEAFRVYLYGMRRRP